MFTVAAVHPDLDHYVFLRVNEDTEGVMVEEETAEARYPQCLYKIPGISDIW